MTQKGLVRRTHRQSLVPQGLQRAWQQRGHPGPQPVGREEAEGCAKPGGKRATVQTRLWRN